MSERKSQDLPVSPTSIIEDCSNSESVRVVGEVVSEGEQLGDRSIRRQESSDADGRDSTR